LRRLTQFATAQGSAVMIKDVVVLKLIKSVNHTAIIKERRQRQSEFAPIVNFLFFLKLLNTSILRLKKFNP